MRYAVGVEVDEVWEDTGDLCGCKGGDLRPFDRGSWGHDGFGVPSIDESHLLDFDCCGMGDVLEFCCGILLGEYIYMVV